MSEEFKKQYDIAMAVKKYGIDYSYLCNRFIKNNPEERKKIEKETKEKLKLINKKTKDLKIIIVENLTQYTKFISKLPNDPKYPIFYRGQNNANYLLNPSALRASPINENMLLKEFCRRFPSEIKKCDNAMEKLVLMQHYGLHTRCLDITEAPLPALYFACADFKKFTQYSETNMDKWGEILLFKAHDNEEQKYPDSNTVSIMANTAFQDNSFGMGHIQISYRQDNHLGAYDDFISLKHILRHSVIVRTEQNNPRIRNQQGAFILVNSNNIEMAEITYENGETEIIEDKFLFDNYTEHMSEYIKEAEFLKNLKEDLNLENPNKKIKKIDIYYYEKTIPYEQSESVPEYVKTDPFDINRLFYKNNEQKRLVVLIPPYAKENILKELAQNKITEDFIYPDMDTVSNELNNTIGK